MIIFFYQTLFPIHEKSKTERVQEIRILRTLLKEETSQAFNISYSWRNEIKK